MKKKQIRWKTLPPPYEIGRDGFENKDLKKDIDGWVDAKIYHPFPYDLVSMKPEGKAKPGWWTGVNWEGYRLEPNEVILYWKQEAERRYASKKE